MAQIKKNGSANTRRGNSDVSDRRPTLKTIAYITGLGVTTVSRALSDAPDIGKSTKERVRLVAREIGYRPNRAGVRLRTGKTNVISLVMTIEKEAMSVSSHLVYGISEVLADTPYHLIVTPYRLSSDPMDAVRYVVESGSADGIIMSRIEPEDARVQYLTDHHFPFATHGRTNMGIDHPYYDFDNEEYAHLAVEILVKRGRKRLALLAPPLDLNFAQHMTAGFTRGIEENDLLEIPIRRVTIDDTHEEIQADIERIMRSRHHPDGLICGSADAAVAATAGIEAAGFEIGKDIDLFVKESFNMMQKFRSEILVVHEDFYAAGKGLAHSILQIIDGGEESKLQVLEQPKLVPISPSRKLPE